MTLNTLSDSDIKLIDHLLIQESNSLRIARFLAILLVGFCVFFLIVGVFFTWYSLLLIVFLGLSFLFTMKSPKKGLKDLPEQILISRIETKFGEIGDVTFMGKSYPVVGDICLVIPEEWNLLYEGLYLNGLDEEIEVDGYLSDTTLSSVLGLRRFYVTAIRTKHHKLDSSKFQSRKIPSLVTAVIFAIFGFVSLLFGTMMYSTDKDGQVSLTDALQTPAIVKNTDQLFKASKKGFSEGDIFYVESFSWVGVPENELKEFKDENSELFEIFPSADIFQSARQNFNSWFESQLENSDYTDEIKSFFRSGIKYGGYRYIDPRKSNGGLNDYHEIRLRAMLKVKNAKEYIKGHSSVANWKTMSDSRELSGQARLLFQRDVPSPEGSYFKIVKKGDYYFLSRIGNYKSFKESLPIVVLCYVFFGAFSFNLIRIIKLRRKIRAEVKIQSQF